MKGARYFFHDEICLIEAPSPYPWTIWAPQAPGGSRSGRGAAERPIGREASLARNMFHFRNPLPPIVRKRSPPPLIFILHNTPLGRKADNCGTIAH